MVTLTEFLLARYAEQATRAPESHRIECQSLDALLDGFGGTEPCDCDLPALLLADVEAKRRIVEWHDETEDCCEERFGALMFDAESEWSAGVDFRGNLTMSQSIGSQAYIGCVTLMTLALPCADHPDYREEWKP